jgi:hemolysin activation/secretion protein
VEVPAATADVAAAAEKPEPKFDVLEYRVLGNTTLATTDIEAAVYPFLGPNRNIHDVEAARAALESAYKAAGRGTVFVDLPEQDVDEGIVRLRVTEGALRRVSVEGARYFSGRSIRAQLPMATAATVPDLPELQRQITALNSTTRDLSVVPVLAAGAVPGTVDLNLKVTDHLPLHGSLELNDQYTADTSRLRLLGSLSYDNLFNRLDSVSLQYQTAPQEPSELDVLVGSYTRNLGDGRRLTFLYVHSNSDVASLGALSVLGRGQVFGSRLTLPLANEATRSHALTLGVDYKDFLESIALDPQSTFQTPIHYLNFSLSEASSWTTEQLQFSLSGTANFGPRRIVNTDNEFADKRFRGRPNYFYIRSAGSVRAQLPAGFAVTASLAGQFAVEPVIANEQFAIGGADGVRGYLEAEELGDLGFKGSLQIESPSWKIGGNFAQLTGLLFVDAGLVSTLSPLPGEASRADLSSFGAGLRIALYERIDGAVYWAYPLVPGSRTATGDSRILFSVRAAW